VLEKAMGESRETRRSSDAHYKHERSRRASSNRFRAGAELPSHALVCQALSRMSLWTICIVACLGLDMAACRTNAPPAPAEASQSADLGGVVAPESVWRPEPDNASTAQATHGSSAEPASSEARATVETSSAASSSAPSDRAPRATEASSSLDHEHDQPAARDDARALASPSGTDSLSAAPARNGDSPVAAIARSETPDNGGYYETSTSDGPLRIHRGDGHPPLEIPRDEQLFYDVSINLGVLGSLSVGQVVLSAGVEPYVPGLPLPGEPPPKSNGRETGWIHSLASGYYLGYRLVHNLDVRLLPQDWPASYYRDTQNGTENRRSELRIGKRNGEFTAAYVNDYHCHGCNNPEHFVHSGFLWQKLEHCPKCKLAEHRVWGGPVSRTVPAGSVDLLSAVFLARTMVEDGLSEIEFPVVNEQKLWNLKVQAREHKHVSTPAGEFACVLITLATTVPADEPHDAKSFSGLFGIRGDIRIWMEEKTGVPVVIQGDLPVPVLGKLEVDVELKKFAGTPRTFVAR
jgi:hypothetical protein